MWNWLINLIPDSQLNIYRWRFGLAGIVFSISGGLCGWIALDIRDRSSRINAIAEENRVARLKSAEEQLTKAKAQIRALNPSQEQRRLLAKEMKSLLMEPGNLGPEPV